MPTEDDFQRWLDDGIVPPYKDIDMPRPLDALFNRRSQRYTDLSTPNALQDALDRFRMRDRVIARFGFAVPCQEAVDALRALSPLVEVGAGTGYWSALLSKAGADIIATDLLPQGTPTYYGFTVGTHCPIVQASGEDAVRAHPERNVLMVWPSLGETWAAQAVAAMQPGRVLALVAEGSDGATGDETLFERLASDFEEIGFIPLPQWENMHDDLTLYRKLTPSE